MVDIVKVLFVDDDYWVCQFWEKKLTESHFRVTSVHDAQEAMNELAINHYDIMITNFYMPIMDGLSLIEWVYHNIKPRPFIFFHPARRYYDPDKLEIIERGANLVMSKMTYEIEKMPAILWDEYRDFISYKRKIALGY